MQQALGETGLYRADLAEHAEAGLGHTRIDDYQLAIVDFGAMPDPMDYVATMRGASSTIRIVGMPAGPNDPQSDLYQSIVDGWLAMPFYLPNLLDTLASLVDTNTSFDNSSEARKLAIFPSAIPHKEKNPAPAPEWLQDVNRVAQHLTRLSLESAAQAALITRGSQLWAYAGQLPQPAAEELAHLVGHYWAHDGGSDLARFVRLESTNGEFMMYATSLGDDYVLALAFEAETPFTEMRTHAGSLARQLSRPPKDMPTALEVDSTPQHAFAIDDIAAEELPTIPSDWRPDQAMIAGGRQDFFDELLKNLEIPVSDSESMAETIAVHEDTPPSGLLYEWDVQGKAEPPELPPQPQRESVVFNLQAEEEPRPVLEIPKKAPPPSSLSDTLPTTIKAQTDVCVEVIDRDEDAMASPSFPAKPEPPLASLHNLTYANVLVPRLPHHHLVGDLADNLATWVRQLSLAFGWRLEHLALRPDYLHWIAVVPPDDSPGMMVHHLRMETSRRIFIDFPRFERENPSGEFWASDYLIVNGRDPFSRKMVQEFISNVRSRQGAQ